MQNPSGPEGSSGGIISLYLALFLFYLPIPPSKPTQGLPHHHQAHTAYAACTHNRVGI